MQEAGGFCTKHVCIKEGKVHMNFEAKQGTVLWKRTENFLEQKIFISSANNTNFNTSNTLQISFIYKISSLGPNPDPGGTPQTMAGMWHEIVETSNGSMQT